MRDLLRRRGFRRLIIGQTISAFGDWIGTIGLMVLVLQVTNSSTAVGGVLVLRLLPATIAGPLAARAVRRSDRKTTMLRMDAARAVMVAALPFVPGVWWHGPSWFNAIWWIYFWAFMIELASLVFLPARDSAIPELIGAHEEGGGDLGIANGLVLGSSYGMIPLGAAAFGGLLVLGGWLGLDGAHRFLLPFGFDALTYIGSYVAIAGIPSLGNRLLPADEKQDVPDSFHDALRIPLVRVVLPATAAVTLGVGALFSIGVGFVEDVLHATPTQFGVLIAVFGVGAATGLGASRLLHGNQLLQVRIGVAGLGAVIAGMSLSPTIWIAYLGAVVFGLAATATLVAGMSLLQDELEGAERELAFTAFHIVVRAGLAIAALAAGAVADAIGTVHVPVLGHLAPERLVLCAAGVVVWGSAALIRAGRLQGTFEESEGHVTGAGRR
ncbi:MAG: MFS transporter [Frankiaceae bacterium]